MFINTGGVPEQHRRHTGGKLHLQPQRHYHGHRHPQQFGQHHPAHRSGRLAARRRRLLPAPRHHGSLSAAALLLKPWTPQAPTPSSHPSPTSLFSPSPHCTETTRLTRMDSTTLLSSLSNDKTNMYNSRHFFQ